MKRTERTDVRSLILILILAGTAGAADPIPITPGEYITGSIGPGQSNAYSFQANAGDAVTVLLQGSAFWPVSFSAHVELRGPDGEQVAAASGSGGAAITAQPVAQTGTYLAVVLAGYYTGTYGLTAIKNPGPNATDPDGGDIAPGESRTGTTRIGDLDAFAFRANAGDTVTVFLAGVTNILYVDFSADVELHGPDGTRLAGAQGGGSATIVSEPLPQNGTYLAIVRAGYYTGTYGLTVIKNPGPNATDPDGGNMASGEQRTGTIGLADLDAFAFWANVGDTATILIHGTQMNWYFFPHVELQGPDGAIVATASGSSARYAAPTPAIISAQPLAKTGTYLAIVRDRVGIYSGWYDIALRREPPALLERVSFQPAVLSDANVTGDLAGTVDFNDLQFAHITTGSFAGQGYSKGTFRATLEGATYDCAWGGAVFFRPQEKKIYLRGAVSGGLLATVEGHLTETTPDSGVYDWYEATWKIRPADAPTTSATLNVSGTILYEPPVEVLETPIYVLQDNFTVPADGDYGDITLGAVVTSLQMVSPAEGGTLEGFSTISFTSKAGSGQGWTCDVRTPTGTTEILGVLTDPFFGILSGTIPQLGAPHFTIRRIDLGLPPMADVEVDLSTPGRVSPGQTFDYLIEYRNQGLMMANDMVVVAHLPYDANYISASGSAVYRPIAQEVIWQLGDVPPRSKGYLHATVMAKWGLPRGTRLDAVVLASTSSAEKDVSSESDALPPDLQRYLEPLPRELIDAEFVDEMQFLQILSSDPRFQDAYQFAEELGATDMSTPVRLQFSDGTETFVVPMASAVPGEITLLLKLSAPRDASFLMRFDDLGVSLLNRHTGFSYNGTTGAPIFWGEPGGCMWDQCMEPCLAKKGGMWLLEQVIVDLLSAQSGMLWQILKSGISCVPWLTSVNCCYGKTCPVGATPELACREMPGALVDCLKSLPIVGLIVEIEDCVIECLFGNPYGNPDGACGPPVNGDEGGPTITPAHDPNRKFGPQGDVAAGQKLDYRVEYENEGEGYAFGVYFTDTLDPSLDDSTLEIGPVVDVNSGEQIGGVGTYNADTRTITWFVGQVDPGQGGYADFSVNVRADAPAGTEIINVGTVYFPSVPEQTKTNAIVSTVTTSGELVALGRVSFTDLSLLAVAWLESDWADASR